jgi:hypothetical protein
VWRQLNVARLHSSDQSYHRELARTVLTVGADSPDVVLTTYDMVKSMNVLSMKVSQGAQCPEIRHSTFLCQISNRRETQWNLCAGYDEESVAER